MANEVVVLGETGTIAIQAIPLGGAADIEFRAASFTASPTERRVVNVFLFIPTGGKNVRLRLEVTDDAFAQEDIWGQPMQRIPKAGHPAPYAEPRYTRRMDEGR